LQFEACMPCGRSGFWKHPIKLRVFSKPCARAAVAAAAARAGLEVYADEEEGGAVAAAGAAEAAAPARPALLPAHREEIKQEKSAAIPVKEEDAASPVKKSPVKEEEDISLPAGTPAQHPPRRIKSEDFDADPDPGALEAGDSGLAAGGAVQPNETAGKRKQPTRRGAARKRRA